MPLVKHLSKEQDNAGAKPASLGVLKCMAGISSGSTGCGMFCLLVD